jgi:hypothetical protein
MYREVMNPASNAVITSKHSSDDAVVGNAN